MKAIRSEISDDSIPPLNKMNSSNDNTNSNNDDHDNVNYNAASMPQLDNDE